MWTSASYGVNERTSSRLALCISQRQESRNILEIETITANYGEILRAFNHKHEWKVGIHLPVAFWQYFFIPLPGVPPCGLCFSFVRATSPKRKTSIFDQDWVVNEYRLSVTINYIYQPQWKTPLGRAFYDADSRRAVHPSPSCVMGRKALGTTCPWATSWRPGPSFWKSVA